MTLHMLLGLSAAYGAGIFSQADRTSKRFAIAAVLLAITGFVLGATKEAPCTIIPESTNAIVTNGAAR